MEQVLGDSIRRFASGCDLPVEECAILLDALINSSDEAALIQLFSKWNSKGITKDEIVGIARVLRNRCIRVKAEHEGVVDIVGTGGSRVKTFNVSTAAAFVAAGAGVPIAKHGNKAATSSTGSADVLGALGVQVAASAGTAQKCLNEIGICFMFAPNHHRLSPTLAKVRRGLGYPTIFNCVGPLCNPAGALRQVIGVWSPELLTTVAEALAELGTQRSWVVHGHGGLDEIAVSGSTHVVEIHGTNVSTFDVGPESFGIKRKAIDPKFDVTPEKSAELIADIIEGRDGSSWMRDLVVLNAAAAIHLSGVDDPITSRERAERSIRDGSARAKLEDLRRATNGPN